MSLQFQHTSTTFHLQEDQKVQIQIEQLGEKTWVATIGEVRNDIFFGFVTFFAKSEEQARDIVRVWERVSA